MKISFSVPFAAGLQRPRMTTRGGYAHQYDTKQNKAYKRAIQWAYKQAASELGVPTAKASKGTPVAVSIYVHRELPKSTPKRIEAEADTKKPDIDNCAKLIFDALNSFAWVDDAQVNTLIAKKLDRTRCSPHMDICIIWSD